MQWTRSETVALAANQCVICEGLGLKPGRGGRRLVPCSCVFREIFRICLKKFEDCVTREKYMSHVSGEIYGSNGQRRMVWSRKIEEYIADFYLIAKRELTEEEWRVFSARFLLKADWKLCCEQLKMDKGNFFHAVYRIQQKLGRAFREVSPYPLFPLDEYFRSTIRGPRPEGWMSELGAERPADQAVKKVVPLRPPMRKVAQPVAAPGPERGNVVVMPVRREEPEPWPRAA